MPTPELKAVAYAALFTGILWIPIVLNRFAELGIWKTLANPQPDQRASASWAFRLAAAHRNAVENLVVFAPLAIGVSTTGVGNELTAAAGMAYVGARIVHAVVYALGIPVARTLAFAVGFGAEIIMGLRLLGLI